MSEGAPGYGVMVPFLNRFDKLANCASHLLNQMDSGGRLILIDDGSQDDPQSDLKIQNLLGDARVVLLSHPENLGVAAARNTGVEWCRQQGIEILIMIDSDCEPLSNFVAEHLRLHRDFPEVACFGGGIVGRGRGFWARLDNVTTWVHSVPEGPIHDVKDPYHLPTTNMSLKLSHLPTDGPAFDARLITGEDAVLVRELRTRGEQIKFSPQPMIFHQDRETFGSVLWHHYQYGRHQYFVQLGGHLSPRCFKVWYRLLFLPFFLLAAPGFALLGSILNIKPWLIRSPSYLRFYPFILGLWIAKSFAVLESAIRPHHVIKRTSVGARS